jgi:MraZ protein
MIKTGFIGEYEHSLDEKDRVSIPSKYKKYIEEITPEIDARGRVVLVKGREKCIEVFPAQDWGAMVASYNQGMSLTDNGSKDDIRKKARDAFEADIDRSGRIRVPSKLKEYAGLSKKVIMIGVIDRFEIWDEAALNEFDSKK